MLSVAFSKALVHTPLKLYEDATVLKVPILCCVSVPNPVPKELKTWHLFIWWIRSHWAK